jgi:1,5-anhydro-D-fructose reductase (1,5-anhydro-D-mannitol-forming)
LMSMKPVKWGMIGCGDVTEHKSAPSFNRIPGSRLVAVGSRTPERAEDYARRHAVPVWHRDPFEVIHDPYVDIVYIATPPGSHREYALESIGAGKPVYIEKPMARTWQECREINEAAVRARVPVFVAYYRRSLEYFTKVKEIVEQGQLGKILQISMQQHFPARDEDHDRARTPWRVIPEISGGGYFHDMGCHALDILFHIFGDPVHATGTTANLGGLYDAADTTGALLTLPGNLQVTGSWSFVTPAPFQKDLVEVTGERGKLLFSIFSFDPVRLVTDQGEATFSPPRPEHIQMPLIRSIVDDLNGTGTCPSTGKTGAVTSRVMDQITGIL